MDQPVSAEIAALVDALETKLAEQERTIQWLEAQRKAWEDAAHEHENIIAELRAHAQQRQDALTWLEGQRSNWEQEARARDEIIADLQAHVHRLEEFVQRMTSSVAQRTGGN